MKSVTQQIETESSDQIQIYGQNGMTNSPFGPVSYADSEPVACSCLALAVFFALYFVLRLPWVGHLLTLDEANKLLSVRAFAAAVRFFDSNWFWRSPPLFEHAAASGATAEDGFIGRAEILV